MNSEQEKNFSKTLAKVVSDHGLHAIDSPKRNFPNQGFENLPEYQTTVDAIKAYANAIENYSNKMFEEESE